jgi:hypothetical protein
MSTQDPRIEPLDQLRARRDEVEQMLHDGGWRFDGIKEPLRRWWRRGAVVFTPSDAPSLDTAEEWAKMLDEAAAIAVKPIGAVASSPKHAPHDAARDWAALVGADSREIPTDAHPVVATLDTILRLKAQLQRERAEAKAEIDRLQARVDDYVKALAHVDEQNDNLRKMHSEAVAERVKQEDLRIYAETAAIQERQQANEALAQLHDAQRDLNAIAEVLDEDPERSPAYDRNDQPVPLPERVRVALMPVGIGQSRAKRRAHELEVKLGNIEALDYPGQLKEVCAELHAFQRICHLLGATALDAPGMLMQVLSPAQVVAVLEVEAAEALVAVKRIRCRNPGMSNDAEPLRAALEARQEAQERLRVALEKADHSPEVGNMVEAE